ncbi:hypothetical protein EVAR_25798_1 [Eumeta japonica]|uniref:Uncharacterized protein n=1 Tax=Eumeta variegata TaxID=151549 RepID=A0A4C1VTZ2_EUMVA|nr:hypothetical protein EVAR_25798_1 [Eumeta japonica]
MSERRSKKATAEVESPVAGTLTSVGEVTMGNVKDNDEYDDDSLLSGSNVDMIKGLHAAIRNINAIVTSSTSKLNKADISSIAAFGQDIFAIVATLQVNLFEFEVQVARVHREINYILVEAPTVGAGPVMARADTYAAKLKLPK